MGASRKSREVEKQGEVCAQGDRDRSTAGYKMSKSRGNVVNPDEVVQEYGADSLRLYEMFMGPLEAVKPWSMDGVSGVRGFLDRVWRMIIDDRAEAMQLNAAVQDVEPTAEQNRMLHKTIKAVTRDLEQMSFNTAIARMMEFTNFFLKAGAAAASRRWSSSCCCSRPSPRTWPRSFGSAWATPTTLAYEPWPHVRRGGDQGRHDRGAGADQRQAPRADSWCPPSADKAALEAAARGRRRRSPNCWPARRSSKTIVVPGRMVNFVVK